MKKKSALVLISLMILTLMLTMPNFTPSVAPATSPEGQGPYHWKIELAQKKANANITGFLLDGAGAPIPGTDFNLTCICEEPFPQPTSTRVYWKVKTTVVPTAIFFVKSVDWNKDGIVDEVTQVEENLVQGGGVGGMTSKWYHHQQEKLLILTSVDPPVPCTQWESIEPSGLYYHIVDWADTGYPYDEVSYCDQLLLQDKVEPLPPDEWHVRDYDPGPPGILTLDKLVVVEVHQLEITHDWMISLKQHNANVLVYGYLTEDGIPVTGLWSILCNCTTLQIVDVETPECTLVNDIGFNKTIWDKEGDYPPIIVPWTEYVITQFPWTHTESGVWDDGTPWTVTLTLTEVQEDRYINMGGGTISSGQMGVFPAWFEDEPYPSPFATRDPYWTPLRDVIDIKFEQIDPITGIVKIWVPAETYMGVDHIYFSPRVLKYFRVRVFLEEAGCGVIFTGQGKEPILGCVDYSVFNNNTGVYTFGPDGLHSDTKDATWLDDVLLAGQVDNPNAPPDEHAGGSGSPIGPCLQELRGPDGIIGTGDDVIGRADPDGPDEPGSSLLYLPSTMETTFYDAGEWKLLFRCPWPQLMTTGTSYDKVIEPQSEIDGEEAQRTGEPWEFFAGIDHPGWQVPWKHDKCNAYVTYGCVWSVMDIDTALGDLDVHFKVLQKNVREDCVIADIDCNEIVDIVDIVICALTYEKQDEGFGIPEATPGYDARGDVADPRDYVDIVDIVRIAINYDWQLTPNCILK